jgi:septum formation protein
MLILASSSPRRKELLKKLVPSFTIVVPSVDERLLDEAIDPKDLPEEEARQKAYVVHAIYPNDEVLSCDTVVILNGSILGKPKDEEDAKRMLRLESGKRQIVLSGYTYIGKGKEITRSVATSVYFNELSEEEIASYVATFHPLDKAGAYGIQDEAGLINRIEGSYDNVMGFPSEDIAWHVFARQSPKISS